MSPVKLHCFSQLTKAALFAVSAGDFDSSHSFGKKHTAAVEESAMEGSPTEQADSVILRGSCDTQELVFKRPQQPDVNQGHLARPCGQVIRTFPASRFIDLFVVASGTEALQRRMVRKRNLYKS